MYDSKIKIDCWRSYQYLLKNIIILWDSTLWNDGMTENSKNVLSFLFWFYTCPGATIFTIIWNLLLKNFLGHFPNLLKYSDCCNVAYAMDKEIITKKNWLALFLNSRKLGVDFQNSDYFGLSGVTFILESNIQNWEYDFFWRGNIYSM